MANRVITSDDKWSASREDIAMLTGALTNLAPLLSDDALDNATEHSIDRILAIRLVARLAAEAKRLHDGEAPDYAYEGAVPTPEQWMAFYNSQDTLRRRRIVERVIANGEVANICNNMSHHDAIASLERETQRLRDLLDRRVDMTIQQVRIEIVREYAGRLINSGNSEKARIGEELLKAVGV